MDNNTRITPYLGRQSRLSQVWINRWTILLILVLIRTLIAIANVDDNLASAREKALSACLSVESVGSSVASMPHYMSQGVNKLTAGGITKAVNGLMSMVGLTIQAVEEIIVFVIGMYTNTYLCLITFVVTGSIEAALSLIQKANDFLKSSVDAIGDDLGSAVSGFQNTLNSFMDTISGLPLIGDAVKDKPSIDLSSQITSLKGLTISNNLDSEIVDLKSKIPDFSEVKNFTDSAIRLPFEKLRELVTTAMGTYSFNSSVLPVPVKEALTFCSDNNDINDFFDKLAKVESIARKVFIAVIIIAAIAVCAPMAWREIRRWNHTERLAAEIDGRQTGGLDAVYIATRPYTAPFGIWVSSRANTLRNQNIIRWMIAYATSTQALFVLTLAAAGLFSCLCQVILLKALEDKVPGISDEIGNFTAKIMTSLDETSNKWATDTNSLIRKETDDVNKNLLGWVTTSTEAVNGTLNIFIEKTTELLNATFGTTFLREPMQDVFDCLIGLKVEAFQTGLTWVHDHAKVDFPLLDNTTFSIENLGGSDADFLASSNATSDKLTGAILSVTEKLAKGIRTEALISTGVLLVWVLIVLIGFIRGLTLFLGHDKMAGGGGVDESQNRAITPGMGGPAGPGSQGTYTADAYMKEAYGPDNRGVGYVDQSIPPVYDGEKRTIQMVDNASSTSSSFTYQNRTPPHTAVMGTVPSGTGAVQQWPDGQSHSFEASLTDYRR